MTPRLSVRPLLAFLPLLALAACSGKTHDVYVGGGSTGGGDTTPDDGCPVAIQPRANVCNLQLSGTAAEQQKTLTAIDAVTELWGDVDDLVKKVYDACATTAFFLGGASSTKPLPTGEDARLACAELTQIIRARGPFTLSGDATPSCTDVPRSACSSVTLPPRRVCATPALHLSPADPILADHLPVLLAAQAELKGVAELGTTVAGSASSLANAPAACVPDATTAVATSTKDLQAVTAALSDLSAALGGP